MRSRLRGRLALASVLMLGVGLGFGFGALAVEAQGLAAQRPLIEARHPDLEWVDTRTLARWLARPEADRPVLLDARRADEHRVSHLRGARRIDPDTTRFTDLGIARDQLVVVYCSVGFRSGEIAHRMGHAGYRRVYNLEGGLFAWANEGRPLHRGEARVEIVHPYDATWGLMLDEERRAPLR